MYYKVISDDKIVDVGSIYLRWSYKWNQYFTCDVDQAEAVQSDKGVIYSDNWLKVPPDIIDVPLAKIVVIEKNEYDELKELLNDDKIIDVPVEEYPIIEEPVIEPEVIEKPKTITEMRNTIEEQNKQIEMLTGCILEMSEKLYGKKRIWGN